MAAGGKGSGGQKKGVEEEDLYAVLGLTKDCSDSELRAAYKKLALRWHPDRCSAKDSKANFQAIQEAYSVLSDSTKRLMYDFGVYNDNQIDDGEGEYGMCDFLGEMAAMMQQNKPSGNAEESFEELQALFLDMFSGVNDAAGPTSFGDDCGDASFGDIIDDTCDDTDFFLRFSSSSASCSSSSSTSPSYSYSDISFAGSKRGAVDCDPVAADVAAGFSDLYDSVADAFFGGPTASDTGSSTTRRTGAVAAAGDEGAACGARRVGRKQKVSLGQDVASGAGDVVPAASC